MRLLWLLASLLLLLPTPAAASVAMPGQESQPTYQAPSDDTRWFVLSERPGTTVAASDRRTPRPLPFVPPALLCGVSAASTHAHRSIAASPPGTWVPACQRLPYRATAPPLR